MSIIIVGDSTMDLSNEVQKKLCIPCVPFSVEFGMESKRDTTFQNEEMYEYNKTHKDICRSSAVNVGECIDFFKANKKDEDEMIYFSISSKLSSGLQNATIAKGDDDKITIYDSKSFSLGIALLAIKAKALAEKGMAVKDIIPIIDEYRENVNASLIVQDLSYMARGGRISKATAIGAGLLKIHPILSTKDGTFIVVKKLIGATTKKLARKYVDSILEGVNDIDYSLALVGYTSERDEGVDDIIDELKNKGFEKVLETKTNSTNAVHSGPNAYGVAFIASTKPKKLDIHMISTILNKRASISHVEKEIKEVQNRYNK